MNTTDQPSAHTGVKPTIVLVHGAYADASSWNGVIERLQPHGYTVIAPANPLRGVTADAAYTASLLGQIDGPVLLAGHSYGGAVITNAATSARNVVGLVFVAAFAPEEGETLGEVENGSKDSVLGTALVQYQYPAGPGGQIAVEFAINPALLREAFAADLPAETTALMAATQRPAAVAAFSDASGPPAWRSLPSWAVVATGDKAAGADVVRSQAQRAGADIVEVEGSHVIMISQPQAVTDHILKAARAVADSPRYAMMSTAARMSATDATIQPGTSTSFGALKQVDAGLLSVGYGEAGRPDGPVVLLLHGWPYDIDSFADVTPLLVSRGYRVIVPYLRGYGTTRFLSDATLRNGQQSVLAVDVIAFMDALGIGDAIIGGFDWGARSANVVAALWPHRCKALVSVSGYLIGSQAANEAPLPPRAEYAWWYQYYFATERGRAGYDKYRREFAKLIWQLASPKWAFDDATFARSAAAFDNPDHVAIVIHNYRWRLGLAAGEPHYGYLERRLAAAPAIAVTTITLEGDANGAPHADATAYAGKFTGKYEHRLIEGGVGHNLPQEAPRAFAQAVIDADGS